MKLNNIRPMMYTRQLQETVDFYTQQLGFTCENFNADWGWAALERDDIQVMVALPNEHIPFEAPKFTGSFYINTTAVDDLWEELKEKALICYPLETFDYGMKEFAIYDKTGICCSLGRRCNLTWSFRGGSRAGLKRATRLR